MEGKTNDTDLLVDHSIDSAELDDFRPNPNVENDKPSQSMTGDPSGIELPKIMASLGLNETAAPSCTSTRLSPDDCKLRRSQRKCNIRRVSTGGICKRRDSTLPRNLDKLFPESEDEIEEFYENYNKKFIRPKPQSLETIFEESKLRNGTVVLTGPKKRRILTCTNKISKVKLRSRQLKIKSMLLNRQIIKKPKGHLTIEDVKERLAESGLLT